MNTAEPAPCELLPWDTEFFGCRIARVCGNSLCPETATQIEDWCRTNQIRAVYFLSRADDPVSVRTAEQSGFGLVDVRVAFQRPLNANEPEIQFQPDNIRIRPVQPDDVPLLQAIARAAHHDTRFFSDTHFSPQRAEDLYAVWVAKEAQGRAQMVLVAAITDDRPAGYVSCHLDAARSEAQIGLVGVAAAARDKGIGGALVRAAIHWCRNQGAGELTVVTQGKNFAAQRLYQRCGFQTRDLKLWYHKWYPAPK